jgi:hypothetical protein
MRKGPERISITFEENLNKKHAPEEEGGGGGGAEISQKVNCYIRPADPPPASLLLT